MQERLNHFSPQFFAFSPSHSDFILFDFVLEIDCFREILQLSFKMSKYMNISVREPVRCQSLSAFQSVRLKVVYCLQQMLSLVDLRK